MLRITPDTNIIVSGLYGSGNPRRILELAESGAIKIVVSQSILDEVADVLQREKFGWSAAEVKYALRRIVEIAELVDPHQTVNVIKDDLDDNRILECAVAASSNHLIIGDKHLLKFGQFGQTKIMKRRFPGYAALKTFSEPRTK